MIGATNLNPTVFTSVNESGILLAVRYLCEPRHRRDSTQEIWEGVLDRFAACDDIDFAYLTVRYFNNVAEGEPGTGGSRPRKEKDMS